MRWRHSARGPRKAGRPPIKRQRFEVDNHVQRLTADPNNRQVKFDGSFGIPPPPNPKPQVFRVSWQHGRGGGEADEDARCGIEVCGLVAAGPRAWRACQCLEAFRHPYFGFIAGPTRPVVNPFDHSACGIPLPERSSDGKLSRKRCAMTTPDVADRAAEKLVASRWQPCHAPRSIHPRLDSPASGFQTQQRHPPLMPGALAIPQGWPLEAGPRPRF
jgi:hypothetical protein